MTDLKTRLKLDLERGITPPLEDAGFTYGFNGDYLRQGSVLISHILIDFGFLLLYALLKECNLCQLGLSLKSTIDYYIIK